ncbi:DEAD/DEAH box helicase, partial [Ancylostoma duodenale]
KRKKRKGDKTDSSAPAKKVKFAADVTTAPLQKSLKQVENAAEAPEKNEEIQRIVIDDEEDMEEDDDTKVKSSWDELYLPEPIMEAIREMRFQNPTEIQRQVLPLAVRDRCDVLGAAETGSGKTLAYAIPMVARLLELPEEPHSSSTGPKALILAPTRELVVQVMKHVTALLKHTSFKVFPIVGGLAQVRQARILKEQKPEVIVATPGRLWAMMKEEEEGGGPACQYLSEWSGLLCLVVDETDRMVEKGHFEEMQDILQFVRKSATEKLQTLVFSATLTYVHREQTRPGHANKKELTPQQKIKELIQLTGMRPNCKIVDITRAFGTAETLVETRINCSNLLEKDTTIVYLLERYKEELIQLTGMRPNCKVVDITRAFGTAETLVETRINCSNLLEKDTTIVYLLERYKGRTLMFTNSVDASRRMYGILKLLKLQPLMIHAKMEQKVRLKNLEKFADVAARGLDIQGIDNVIHYQVPKTAEIYIHRSGRTARASRKGLSVLIVDSKDAHLYRRLCKNLNREKDLPVFPIDCVELMRRLKTRVEIASALDTLAHRGKKIRLSENWFTKMIREADLEMDDMREHEQANANDEMNSIKAQEAELQAELRAELAEPLPSVDRLNIPKTRYINPDVVAQYAKIKSTSTNTLDSLEEKLAEVEEKKKKARKLITTHQLKAKSFKRRKKF